MPNVNSQQLQTFLSPEERQLVADRINVDRRDFENEHLTVAGVLKELGNPRIWTMGLLFLSSTLPASIIVAHLRFKSADLPCLDRLTPFRTSLRSFFVASATACGTLNCSAPRLTSALLSSA